MFLNMPIKDPKIKDRPDTDPKRPPDTGPDPPVKEPKKDPPVKEPDKKKPEKR